MNLTRQHLKLLIEEQITEMKRIEIDEQDELPGEEEEPELSYTGMKTFAQNLLDATAIPATTVEKARMEMGKNPNAATMAQFITIILKSFGVDQKEMSNIMQKVKTSLDK